MNFIEFISQLEVYKNNKQSLIKDIENYLSSINDKLKVKKDEYKVNRIFITYSWDYNDNTYDPRCVIRLDILDTILGTISNQYLDTYCHRNEKGHLNEKETSKIEELMSVVYNCSSIVLDNDYHSGEEFIIEYDVKW